jgi:hypothetical protein
MACTSCSTILSGKLRETKLGGLVFFQIHKDGQAVDGSSYPSLEEACRALEKAQQGGQVAEVDAFDRIIRRYTPHECSTATRKFSA